MTPTRRAAETANKRAERQRRKEAGEQRVEVWLSGQSMFDLSLVEGLGLTRSEAVAYALRVAVIHRNLEP